MKLLLPHLKRSAATPMPLPEIYSEVSPHFWPAFNQTIAAGTAAFMELGAYYKEIYLFSALPTSCEGAGQKVLQYTAPSIDVPERPIRAKGSMRVLRVLNFPALLEGCIAHDTANAHTWGRSGRHPIMGQMNLWFVPP